MRDMFYLCLSIGIIFMIYIGVMCLNKSDEIIVSQMKLTSQIDKLFNIASGYDNIKYLYIKTE